jgi:hypothetical protein
MRTPMTTDNAHALLALAVTEMEKPFTTDKRLGHCQQLMTLVERIGLLIQIVCQDQGQVPLDFVEQLLKEGNGQAILLLIGDKRPAAKHLLLLCIIKSDYNQLFYRHPVWTRFFRNDNLLLQKIGPLLVLISTDLESFKRRQPCEDPEWSVACLLDCWLNYVSGWLSVARKAIDLGKVNPLLDLIKQDEHLNPTELDEVQHKFARALLVETLPDGAIELEEISCEDLIKFGSEHGHMVLYYHSRDGSVRFFTIDNLNKGDQRLIIIDDNNNLSARMTELHF